MRVKISVTHGRHDIPLIMRDLGGDKPAVKTMGDEIIELDDVAIRMLTAMLAGDPLVLKDGFLFKDRCRRFYLYGQQQTDKECCTAMLLLRAGLISPMTGGASPALTQHAVTEYGFFVAKKMRDLRAAVYDLA